MFKYELGTMLRDKVTKFTGICMCRIEYFTGCLKYGLARTKLAKDNKIEDNWTYLDEIVLEEVKGRGIKKEKSMGGPAPTPNFR